MRTANSTKTARSKKSVAGTASSLNLNIPQPHGIIVDPLKWKLLIRNVLRAESTMLVGESGSGKTSIVRGLASALDRPFFKIPMNSSQEPRSFLVGNVHVDVKRGTYMSTSEFVRAIQTPNAVIMLDEISRANPDAANILLSVIDPTQRYLSIDESNDSELKHINVAEGVTFVATANIGTSYTYTRIMDLALVERFMRIDIDFLSIEEELRLIAIRTPDCPKNWAHALAKTAELTRAEVKKADSSLSRAVSTRAVLKAAELMSDGFTFNEAMSLVIFPMFSQDGDAESEYTFMQQIVQANKPSNEPSAPISRS